MHEDYIITPLPNEKNKELPQQEERYMTKEERVDSFKAAIKKLVLQKPHILPGCKIADEIRQEIKQEEQENDNNGR